MNFTTEFWVQIAVYAVSFGVMFGKVSTELRWMKEKLDKHNSFQDRLVKCEEASKSAHYRIDDIRHGTTTANNHTNSGS